MSQENFETVRKHFVALNARDVDAFLACCTDDVEVVPTIAAIEGPYRGRSGLERFFADTLDTAPDFEVRSERMEAVGDKVISFDRGSASGRASEVAAEIALTSVYEFQGGKISRIQVFADANEALEAVGLSDG
jgi:ketosteroid isomerase-like protein